MKLPKAKAKAKAKRKAEVKEVFSPKKKAKVEREIKKGIAALDERIDTQHEYATKIIGIQSRDTKNLIDAMIDRQFEMTGELMLFHNGTPIHALDESALRRMHEKQFTYFAVRFLVALAEWGIQTGDFKLPKDLCAKCGKGVKK